MRIAVVHTVGSVCGCAQAVAVGLHALGHEVRFYDSEAIGYMAGEISRSSDLVIDHTDTFRGTGFLRPFVRWTLEGHGARIVGSDARACLLADDKITAKTCLANAGVPVPAGVTVTSADQELPSWLRMPVVLKPAFEHMSRGLFLAKTADEARAAIAELTGRFRQPFLVESFIPGREFAVSLLEDETGLRMLPPLEWRVHAGGWAMLTGKFKQADVPPDRQDTLRAVLTPERAADLEGLSCLAFRALGLRDYARFDIRLSAGGTFYFLEANTTPSLEPFEALALSAKWAGMDYATLVERMLAAALRRYGACRHNARTKCIDLPSGPLTLVIPDGVHDLAPSTLDLAKRLDVREGDRVLDLGCGAGILAIAAAKIGARQVVATDVDPRALDATLSNAAANGVGERIAVVEGDWFEALRENLPGGLERFDVIIATPPQTPGPRSFGPRYGGPDGLKYIRKILQGVPRFLMPDHGRLWLLAISLANPPEMLRLLQGYFHEVRVVHETGRSFTGAEYDACHPGLMDYFLKLRSTGQADFQETGGDSYEFRNLLICAREVKERCGN